jgi:RNA-directed DNA polymerase
VPVSSLSFLSLDHPLSVLDDLKAAKSPSDLAKVLGYKASALSFILHQIPPTSKYTSFTIPKKSGGVRTINAPTDKLKALQRHLSTKLYQCRADIDAVTKLKPLSHGFRKSQSIITNAHPHTKSRYVLNLDLEDFFPSINFGRVRGFFMKNNDFKLHADVATAIAQIACHNNELPQGAPSSPVISDLVAHLLDVRLVRLAKKNDCTYSRYADDITFSANQKTFPPTLAIEAAPNTWQLAKPLTDAISLAGFRPNPAKTRMQYRTSRQTVTGLTVNQKVNVQATYYRSLRSMCYQLFKTGSYFEPGKLPTSSLLTIEGRLNFAFQTKHAVSIRREVDIQSEKRDRGVRKLYRRLLFYKHFVQLDRPVIICEGKTDIIYLKLALRKLVSKYPLLAAMIGGKPQRKISFFNHSRIADNVLKLGGGSGGIQLLIKDYATTLKYYRKRPLLHPVIILIDNDDGADEIFAVIQKQFGLKIGRSSTAGFYHLCHNLFLVKTPELGAHGTSRIEDLFDSSIQKTIVEGKSFNPGKIIDTAKEYGKIVLAEKVIRPNANKIDFTAFEKLLDRVTSVLSHYKPPV